jgi:NitT/TauT family transport system substrate-binding protein
MSSVYPTVARRINGFPEACRKVGRNRIPLLEATRMAVLSRFTRVLALVGAVLMLVVGAPKPAAADDDLTVISGSFATAFYEVMGDVADQEGYYKQEHLNVTIQYAGNPSIAVQAVASGKGDIAAMGFEPVIQGYEKGLRMVGFFARNPHLQQVLGVLDNSPIRSLADFKGTTIGELSLGQSGEIYTRVMLAGAGLKPTDYNFAPIGNGAQAIQALTSGRVAGAAFPWPELRIYEVIANQKYRYFSEPLIKDVSDVAYVASPATIAAKADALQRFSRANVKAALLIRENPARAARDFIIGSGQKITPDLLANFTKLYTISQNMLPADDPSSLRIGEMPLRGMIVLCKFMADTGLTSTLVPAGNVVTDQFITYANDFDKKAFIAQVKTLK